MDGLELVSELRREYPHIPVVIMTAFGSEETAVEALRARAASYVPKRNLTKELMRTVETVWEEVSERFREAPGFSSCFLSYSHNDKVFARRLSVSARMSSSRATPAWVSLPSVALRTTSSVNLRVELPA